MELDFFIFCLESNTGNGKWFYCNLDHFGSYDADVRFGWSRGWSTEEKALEALKKVSENPLFCGYKFRIVEWHVTQTEVAVYT